MLPIGRIFLVMMSSLISTQAAPAEPWKTSDVADQFFGTTVSDPFRWLEDEDSEPVREFIDAQNERTDAWIPAPVTERFAGRLSELINYPRRSVPTRLGEDLVITERNTGLQRHAVIFKQRGVDGEPEVLLDPNTFSENGTVALSTLDFTRDGALVAYGKSEGGSDNQTIFVRDVAKGEDLPGELRDMRFSAIAWAPDNSGFWYNKYPDPAERLNNTIYWHALGSDPAEDPVVFATPDDPELLNYPGVSEDGRFFVVYQIRGTDRRNGVLVRELAGREPAAEGGWKSIVAPGEAMVSPVGNVGSRIFLYTDLDAPMRRVVAVEFEDLGEDAAASRASWKEVIPQTEDLLDSAQIVGGRFVTVHTRDVHSVLEVRDLDGANRQEVALPTKGTVGVVSGRPEDADAYFLFTSYTVPGTIFRLDVAGAKTEEYYRSAVKFDSDAYETRQIFADRDGVSIPVFVTAKKGVPLDGNNPTILYGYGGFGVSLAPGFNPFLIPWLEAGGVYAVANIRGGGEYGTDWHEAAKLGNRQVGFDDFAAAAKLLIDEKITSPERLAIEGGSNGGLLVLVAMLQHPELFGAVVSQVPVTDMLRFHRFGTGRFWTVEYGNAEESAEAFAWLKAYSPLHNIAGTARYPALLVTTADGDDRVVPAHAFKFIAAIQNTASPGTFLLRHQLGAGHGGGKPLDMVIREQAEIYAFLSRALGMETGEE